MQTWNINPQTGDYVMERGAPEQTNSLQVAAYFRLKAKRSRWMYAPDPQWGSNLFMIKKRTTSSDNTLVENTAADALQPIVDSGRASDIEIETVDKARHGISMKVQITDAAGNVERVEFVSLGA